MRKRTAALALAVAALAGGLYRCRSASPPDAPQPPRSSYLLELEEIADDPAGRLDDLSRGLAIVKRHGTQWAELRKERPARPLADYPEAEEALAAVARWARGNPGAPPMSSCLRLAELGKLAIGSATLGTPGGLEIAQLVGYRLLTNGNGLFDGHVGAMLLEKAAERSRELGLAEPGEGRWVPPRNTFARVLAAEALAAKRFLPRDDAEKVTAFWGEVLVGSLARTPEDIVARVRELAPGRLGVPTLDTVEELAATLTRLRR